MTRYARMKRDQRIQEANSTRWSVLAKQHKGVVTSNTDESRADSETKLKKKLKRKKSKEVLNGDALGAGGSDNVELNATDNQQQDIGNTEDVISKKKKKKRKAQKSKVFEEKVSLHEEGERSDNNTAEEVSERRKKMKPTGANCTMSFQELSELSESLFSLTNLEEVKQKVRQLWRDGQLEKIQAAKLIRKWRSRQWQEKHHQNREELVNSLSTRLDSTEEQTLDDVKQLVNEYVTAGKITYEDASALIKNWKKRESRRIKRQLDKGNKSCCFYCRQTGHKFSECPEKGGEMMGSGICFKCGSTEHTSSHCPRKNVRGFPYATCFVCKQQGHLSRDCDQNANGIYPDGGSCNLCGSQKHLKKDCPLRKGSYESAHKEPLIGMEKNDAGGDDDVFYDESGIVTNTAKRRKLERKIVHI